jgi:hypothetical protein
MNCEGEGAPTRQNIKSHLQKYRLLIQKRAKQGTGGEGSSGGGGSGSTGEVGGASSSVGGPKEAWHGALRRIIDARALRRIIEVTGIPVDDSATDRGQSGPPVAKTMSMMRLFAARDAWSMRMKAALSAPNETLGSRCACEERQFIKEHSCDVVEPELEQLNSPASLPSLYSIVHTRGAQQTSMPACPSRTQESHACMPIQESHARVPIQELHAGPTGQ